MTTCGCILSVDRALFKPNYRGFLFQFRYGQHKYWINHWWVITVRNVDPDNGEVVRIIKKNPQEMRCRSLPGGSTVIARKLIGSVVDSMVSVGTGACRAEIESQHSLNVWKAATRIRWNSIETDFGYGLKEKIIIIRLVNFLKVHRENTVGFRIE